MRLCLTGVIVAGVLLCANGWLAHTYAGTAPRWQLVAAREIPERAIIVADDVGFQISRN
jgi:hypothetical protein